MLQACGETPVEVNLCPNANALIPTLQKEGHEVIASQHGLDSHAGDVTNVKRTIARVPGPVVLVGHSYGGSVIAMLSAVGAPDSPKTFRY